MKRKRKRKRSSGGFEAFFEFLGGALNALIWWSR